MDSPPGTSISSPPSGGRNYIRRRFTSGVLLLLLLVPALWYHWQGCLQSEIEHLGKFQERIAVPAFMDFRLAMQRFVNRTEARIAAGLSVDTMDVRQYFESIPELGLIELVGGGARWQRQTPASPGLDLPYRKGDPTLEDGQFFLFLSAPGNSNKWRFTWEGGLFFAQARNADAFKVYFLPRGKKDGLPQSQLQYRFDLEGKTVVIEFNPSRLSFTSLNQRLYTAIALIGFAFLFFLIYSWRLELEVMAAKKAAQEADSAKSKFLAHMSHEIRTPLNGIIGTTTLLMNTQTTEEQTEYLQAANSCGQHLLFLVNDILDFSKIQKGKLELDSSPFEISSVLESVHQTVLEKAREKEIQIIFRVEAAVPGRVVGDAFRLKQVLLNLLYNAVKFSDDGEIVITVELQRIVGLRCLLQFEVSDQGAGLPVEGLEGLFEPFVQGKGSNSRHPGGTGLGLAICKELVAAMSGEIWAVSSPVRGACFGFTVEMEVLPGSPSGNFSPPDALRRQSSQLVSIPKPAWKYPPRILVVDDHCMNRKVASAMLKKIGCHVELASDGADAVQSVRRKVFDLVFMDCQMPGLDGFAATGEIRSLLSGKKHLPIVALTAHAIKGDREKCLSAGMDDYLSKPFWPHSLAEVLMKWIPSANASAEAETSPRLFPDAGMEQVYGVDLDRLAGLKGERPEDLENFRGLIRMFVEMTRSSLAEARLLAIDSRSETFLECLHRLRGSCSLIGAWKMAQAVEMVERQARDNPGDPFDDRIDQVEAEFNHTLSILEHPNLFTS